MSTAEIIAELPRLSAAELAQVQARLSELMKAAREGSAGNDPASHPALGLWSGRSDLPDDPVEASLLLRQRMQNRNEPAVDSAES